MIFLPQPAEETVKKTVKQYRASLTAYRTLFDLVSDMYTRDLAEGRALKNFIADEKGVTSFERDLLLCLSKKYSLKQASKARCSYDFPGIRTELSEKLLFREFSACANPEDFTDVGEIRLEWLARLLPKYFSYLLSLTQHLNGTIARLKIVKMYRAFLIISEDELLPTHICDMFFVLFQSVFVSEFEPMDKRLVEIEKLPQETTSSPDEEEAAIDFFSAIYVSFQRWEIFKLDCRVSEFSQLSLPFIELLKGFHELAKVTQLLVVNEYCRTNGMMLRIMKFIDEQGYGFCKWSMLKMVEILRESFRFLQGPKRKKNFSLMPYFSEDYEDFCASMARKFVWVYRKIYDAARFSANNLIILQNFSTEKTLILQKERFDISEQFLSLLLKTALDQKPKEDFIFNLDFSLPGTKFTDEERDHYMILPLFSDKFMKTFFVMLHNNRRRFRFLM